ncbi:MAG: energy transducer TonB [Muribaculaceae bacterium]|nr:energy transducer TonB [Muribaculaceae bacterium]
MKTIIRLTAVAVLSLFAFSATYADEVAAGEEQQVYSSVNFYSSFPGGMEGLVQFLSENLQYPEEAERQGIEGQVLLKFIVEKDGTVGDVTVLRSVSPELDAEAVRVCKAMPLFKTARNAETGEPIRVMYTLPINFKLPE